MDNDHLAGRAKATGLSQHKQPRTFNVDDQGKLADACKNRAPRALREPFVRVWVQRQNIPRRLRTHPSACRLLAGWTIRSAGPLGCSRPGRTRWIGAFHSHGMFSQATATEYWSMAATITASLWVRPCGTSE